eukprot:356634-Chlamydomonas_euryale.AAC.7
MGCMGCMSCMGSGSSLQRAGACMHTWEGWTLGLAWRTGCTRGGCTHICGAETRSRRGAGVACKYTPGVVCMPMHPCVADPGPARGTFAC